MKAPRRVKGFSARLAEGSLLECCSKYERMLFVVLDVEHHQSNLDDSEFYLTLHTGTGI